MTQLQSLIENISVDSKNYAPNEHVRSALQQKTLIGLFGPFCIGKSAIIGAVCETDKTYAAVQTFTTRPARSNSQELGRRHIDHTPKQLEEILERVSNRSLAQITVHPSTGFLYGTELESYPAKNNLLDILPSSLDGFMRLPFRQFRKYYVVAPLEQWKQRIQEKTQSRYAHELNKRYREAAQNLEWGLQHQDELVWLVNKDDSLITIARQIIEEEPQSRPPIGAIEIARQMQDFAASRIRD